jgi:hypothetical protein
MKVDRDYLGAIAGWMFSILLHGLGIETAIVLAAEFSVLPREKFFQWEISLIAAVPRELINPTSSLSLLFLAHHRVAMNTFPVQNPF